MAGASGRQRVQENCFDFFLIKTPPESLMKQFSTYVRPMFLEIKNLFDKNKVLTTSRDLLLSRLITGKLSVEDLDIKFPMSMKEEGVKE
jgi:type I restriction enzyme S subunit